MAITLDGSNGITTDIASNESATFNRDTTDGDLIILQKDNSTVGSIGNSGSNLGIGAGNNAGILFRPGGPDILPSAGTDASTVTDGTLSIGRSANRFKDLYLSGGVYLGGTGAANHLDDYEEGTWSPVVSGASVAGTDSSTISQAVYTKVGKLVNVSFTISVSISGASGGLDISLPFTADGAHVGALMTDNFNFSDTDVQATAYVGNTLSQMRIYVTRDAASWVRQNVDNSFTIVMTMAYRVS